MDTYGRESVRGAETRLDGPPIQAEFSSVLMPAALSGDEDENTRVEFRLYSENSTLYRDVNSFMRLDFRL